MNKEKQFSIATADLCAVMHNAISAFLREDWLGGANEWEALTMATGYQTDCAITDYIREKFKPFEDRLIEHANNVGKQEEAARNALFVHFTKLAIGAKTNENN